MSLSTKKPDHICRKGYQEIRLPDSFRDYINGYIDQHLEHYNPYLCDREIVNKFAIDCISYLCEFIQKESCVSEAQRLIGLIRNSHEIGSLPVVFIRIHLQNQIIHLLSPLIREVLITHQTKKID